MPRLFSVLGYAALLAMLPVALFGIAGAANEYRAAGIDAIDCDGPISVLIFAIPGLAVYGAGTFIFLKRPTHRSGFVLGALCALISLGLIWNIGSAAMEQWRNHKEHACHAGL